MDTSHSGDETTPQRRPLGDHQVGLMELGTPMSSACNSFPAVCLVKKKTKKTEVGPIGVDNPEGIGAVCLVCFFFHPPSCAAVIASSLLLPAATETRTEKPREREKGEKGREGAVGTKLRGVNTATQHLLPNEEKRCGERAGRGGRQC